ncbi:DUF3006 domain-containing protein [Caproicibacter sp.]|uniref:DUF3006 domain-containing protein n=1 Tax=Caproicibacter sp. TaxID=2814884 RepID=UPI0039891B56
MEAVVERFEKDQCILEFEDGRLIPFPRNLLPEEAREGDVLDLRFKINRERTAARREKIQNMMDDIWLD